MNSTTKRFLALALVGAAAGLLATSAYAATVYDVTTGQHHPLPLNAPQVPGTEVAGNPLAGNPWVYGSRESLTQGPIPGGVAPTLSALGYGPFRPYTATSQAGADVLGGAGSQGDINVWETTVAGDASSVKIIDGLNGIGAPSHDVAGFQETYVRGRVHLYGDGSAPVTFSPIVRFVAPITSTYAIAMNLENRQGDTDGNPSTNIFADQYYVYTDTGTLNLIAQGTLHNSSLSGPTGTGMGPGSGFNVNVNATVSLLAGQTIEFAAGNHIAVALGGPVIALSGTITQVPEPTTGALLVLAGLGLLRGSRRR